VEWELEDDMQLFFKTVFSRMQLDSKFFSPCKKELSLWFLLWWFQRSDK